MEKLIFLIMLTIMGFSFLFGNSVFAIPIQGIAEQNEWFGHSLAVGDFDGNNFDDLAIGVPQDDVISPETGNKIVDAGAVNVIYGSPEGVSVTNGGLSPIANQIWHQEYPGIRNFASVADLFGRSVAAGDFNNDGIDDLAIGAPQDKIGVINTGGSVTIIYGTNGGLSATGNQILYQDYPGIDGTGGGLFGNSLTVGDFNNDGADDLAVGVPFYTDPNAYLNVGVVNVIYGSTGSGLTVTGNQMWHQNSPGIEVTEDPYQDDQFGHSLAAGDFNNDSIDDLAIGVLREDPPQESNGGTFPVQDAGAVNVIYGSSGSGLTGTGNQILNEGITGFEYNPASPFELFGHSLAAGDFDNAKGDDLAIGVPYEFGVGTVNTFEGFTGSGLYIPSYTYWSQSRSGVIGESEVYDNFGYSLASGDFNGDDFKDLAIGVIGEDYDPIVGQNTVAETGSVNVIYGSLIGLYHKDDQVWDQNSTNIYGSLNIGDMFGWSLASGDFNNDNMDDLAIGVPPEDVSIFDPSGNLDETIVDAGAVNVIYGSPGSGLTDKGNILFFQGLDIIPQ
jgi:hypothetical protein